MNFKNIKRKVCPQHCFLGFSISEIDSQEHSEGILGSLVCIISLEGITCDHKWACNFASWHNLFWIQIGSANVSFGFLNILLINTHTFNKS